MRKLNIQVMLLIVIMVLVSACSRRGSDDTVAKHIQDKVAADPETKDSQVTVSAKEGKVTVTGRASTPVAQHKIKEIATEEPGVVDVVDQTTVDQGASFSQEAAPKPEPIVVPAGTVLTIKTGQLLSSKSSQSGQSFSASLVKPVSVDGRLALAAGSTVSGTVVTAKTKGKIKGEGQLDLALTSILVGEHTYEIHTNVMSSTIKGKGKRTSVATGGGAAGGALIGGIAGGGKGAAIGAGVGAAAGFIGGTFTGNKQIELPAESALSFTLAEPLTLPPS